MRVNKTFLVWLMYWLLFNQHYQHCTNQKLHYFVGKRSFSKSWGLRLSVSFSPLPLPPSFLFVCPRPNFLNELVWKCLLRRLEVCSGRHVDVCMQARIYCRPVEGCMEKAPNWMSPDSISKFSFWFVSISKRNWKENVTIYQSIWAFLQVPLSLAWV